MTPLKLYLYPMVIYKHWNENTRIQLR